MLPSTRIAGSSSTNNIVQPSRLMPRKLNCERSPSGIVGRR